MSRSGHAQVYKCPSQVIFIILIDYYSLCLTDKRKGELWMNTINEYHGIHILAKFRLRSEWMKVQRNLNSHTCVIFCNRRAHRSERYMTDTTNNE